MPYKHLWYKLAQGRETWRCRPGYRDFWSTSSHRAGKVNFIIITITSQMNMCLFKVFMCQRGLQGFAQQTQGHDGVCSHSRELVAHVGHVGYAISSLIFQPFWQEDIGILVQPRHGGPHIRQSLPIIITWDICLQSPAFSGSQQVLVHL